MVAASPPSLLCCSPQMTSQRHLFLKVMNAALAATRHVHAGTDERRRTPPGGREQEHRGTCVRVCVMETAVRTRREHNNTTNCDFRPSGERRCTPGFLWLAWVGQFADSLVTTETGVATPHPRDGNADPPAGHRWPNMTYSCPTLKHTQTWGAIAFQAS